MSNGSMIYRNLIRLQVIAVLACYTVFGYKLWTKSYDQRFCCDFMLFNHISFFWFIHFLILGTLLLCLWIVLRKINPKSLVQLELIVALSFILFLPIGEIFLRANPKLLPFDIFSSLGYTEDDKIIKDRIENTLVDKYNEDRELGIIHKPNLSFELKSREFSYPFRTDKYGFTNYYDETLYNNADIVTIGDSFTEGVGAPAEFSYPRQLSKMLNSRILNLGHGSYDCYQFPIVLKRFGIQAHPKIVIMTLWDWNDLQLRYSLWREYCNLNGYKSFKDYSRSVMEEETKRPRFFMATFLKYAGQRAKDLFARYMALWNYGDYRGIYVNGRWFRFPITDAIAYSGKSLAKRLDYLEEYMTEIKALSQKHGFRFIIVYIPSKQLVYNHFLNLPPFQKAKEEMRLAVIDRLKKMDIEVIDVTPVFVDVVKKGNMLFYPIDDHLNRDGYKVLASTIADYLKGKP